MKYLFLFCIGLAMNHTSFSQHQNRSDADTSWQKLYRQTTKRINDLVDTRLEVRFDYDKSYMYGKAWITLKPHFYPTDSLLLDAKGMEIKNVSVVKGASKQPLKYTYDSMQLNIDLDKAYTRNDKYTIYIDYISKPNEYKGQGSAAITDAKGLYFINPKGEDKDKPTQIWTQGETEATSVWCPTIDKPNQKTTQQIAMTVPSKYVSLSNGKLVSQKKNADGTRTDTWKMDLPHAPYLFFMGVGDYSIVKDQYKGKEVSYYVEKEYAPVARKIFGNTPEMMQFFTKILGVDYPWNKYAQIVGRDYVSGAMENTTATLHQESAQQDARQLVDENTWEGTIAHELFHQWFGNLVTTESWSNLTLNESFANYSQVLWKEYKYGKDAGDEENFSDMVGYINSRSEKKDLVRYYYPDKEAMFDAVSYNKGGRILHMLRNYVGDSAFFKALNIYLTKNKFGTAEAHQLRLAFEEVTGEDLNWFWNQWYFGSGHPRLTIDYIYDDNAKNVKVVVRQTQDQKVFQLPIAVDIYNGEKKTRHKAWLENRVDTLVFPYSSKPDLVNVDADKILLAEKKDNKTLANFVHQYKFAGKFLDRREAIDFAIRSEDPAAIDLLKTALNDKFADLRIFTITSLDLRDPDTRVAVEPIIAQLAEKDPKALVRASATSTLAAFGENSYKSIFEKNIRDSSYSVAGAALEGLMATDSSAAVQFIKGMETGRVKGKLEETRLKILLATGDVSAFDELANNFGDMPLSQTKVNLLMPIAQMLTKINDTEKIKKGVDMIVELRDALSKQPGATESINEILNKIASRKTDQAQIDYIKGKTAPK